MLDEFTGAFFEEVGDILAHAWSYFDAKVTQDESAFPFGKACFYSLVGGVFTRVLKFKWIPA